MLLLGEERQRVNSDLGSCFVGEKRNTEPRRDMKYKIYDSEIKNATEEISGRMETFRVQIRESKEKLTENSQKKEMAKK